MNLRVTSRPPTTFPELQLVTKVALVTEGGHTFVVDVVDPLDCPPICYDTTNVANDGSALGPCLVNGGLRVTVNGRTEIQGADESRFDGGIHMTAVNLPSSAGSSATTSCGVTSSRSRSSYTRFAVRWCGHVRLRLAPGGFRDDCAAVVREVPRRATWRYGCPRRTSV